MLFLQRAAAGSELTAGLSEPQVDNFPNNTVLLLHAEGIDGSTTIIDSSIAPKTCTAQGSAAISTSQQKVGGGSILLTGAQDDRIRINYTTDLVLDGDFTIEYWIYLPTNNTSFGMIWNQIENNLGYAPVVTGIDANRIPKLLIANSSANGWQINLASSISIPLATWTHVAYTRSGNAFNIFVNGQIAASTSVASLTLPTLTTDFLIGATTKTGYKYPINAYLDEFRVTKGVARYSTSFIPPTQGFNDPVQGDPFWTNVKTLVNFENADVYFNNTSLLLFGNGTNGSTTIVDSSSSPKTPSFNNATISTAVSKYGGSSIYFNGSSTYIQYADNTAFQFGTGDFTIETWFYLTGDPPANASGKRETSILGKYTSSVPITGYTIALYGDANVTGTGIVFVNFVNHVRYEVSYILPSPLQKNRWYHVAVSRSGIMTRVFLDGNLLAGDVLGNQSVNGTGNPLIIGALNFPQYLNRFPGYIDDLRITKGVARYTSSFIPPQRQFGTLGIEDFSSNNSQFTVTGSPQVITVSPISGNASLQFGANNYISTTVPAFNVSSTPFTIEWSMVFYDTTSTLVPFTISGNGYTFYAGYRYNNIFYVGDGVVINNIASPWDLSINTVYHMAISFDGTTYRVYQNGQLKYSTTTLLSSPAVVSNLVVGAWPALSAYFNGMIDNFRLTIGVARYTSGSYTVNLDFPTY